MKTHMLAKLENRYDEQQMKFLKMVTYLDPRVKHKYYLDTPAENDLKATVKEIVEADQSIIAPTQDQEYHNLQNNIFATPNNSGSSSRSTTPSHSHTHTTGKEKLLN